MINPRRFSALAVATTAVCAAFAVMAAAAVRWTVVSVEGKPAPEATLEIGPGKISGNGGCNRYSAPAKFIRGMVEVGPVVATRMACDRLESEQAFFSALERARKFSVDGQTMKLGDEDGKTLIVLAKP